MLVLALDLWKFKWRWAGFVYLLRFGFKIENMSMETTNESSCLDEMQIDIDIHLNIQICSQLPFFSRQNDRLFKHLKQFCL